tara:strand:- start:30409 stop:31695 length:1287 start_codon:yes stop_codon:yes gene_type:complete
MPKIQLIRRDSTVIELDANSITFDVSRQVSVTPLPIIAQRFALDMNITTVAITIDGIFADDEGETTGTGAAFSIDLSRSAGAIPSSTWYGQYGVVTGSWGAIKTDLDGVEISFKSIGQINANLGESTKIRLANGNTTSVVATESIIGVNISSSTNTGTLSTIIRNALASASIKENTATVAFTTAFSISGANGQQMNNSYYHQTGDVNDVYSGELITIKNKTAGTNGNVSVSIQKGSRDGSNTYVLSAGSLQKWDKAFVVSNLTGGLSNVKMSMGDKVQDILNLSNMSAGGALISPATLTGDVLDLPDSMSSFDVSKFLKINESDVVKKYIVGVRIPYESIASSPLGNRTLRQYIVPAGPGTDYSAEKNDGAYDPILTVDNKIIRPNPYLEQGVAIPVTLMTAVPSYSAGDGYWSYQITLAAVEQLIGL